MHYKKEKKFKSSYKERGFTLIEVLIAMAIFSIGILGVGTMQLRSTSGNTSARIRTEASIWAQDLVETLMLEDYSTSSLLTVGNHNNPPGTVAGNYDMQWTVWNNAGGPIIANAGVPVTQFLIGITPTNNTIIIEVTVTGRGNRRSTVTFVRGQDV